MKYNIVKLVETDNYLLIPSYSVAIPYAPHPSDSDHAGNHSSENSKKELRKVKDVLANYLNQQGDWSLSADDLSDYPIISREGLHKFFPNYKIIKEARLVSIEKPDNLLSGWELVLKEKRKRIKAERIKLEAKLKRQAEREKNTFEITL